MGTVLTLSSLVNAGNQGISYILHRSLYGKSTALPMRSSAHQVSRFHYYLLRVISRRHVVKGIKVPKLFQTKVFDKKKLKNFDILDEPGLISNVFVDKLTFWPTVPKVWNLTPLAVHFFICILRNTIEYQFNIYSSTGSGDTSQMRFSGVARTT